MSKTGETIPFPTAGGPEKDFPLRDTWEDFAGKTRTFEINYDPVPTGFSVQAVEVGKKRRGYEFSSFDPNDPYLALGRVRGKIRRALATRYLKKNGTLTHNDVRGRITYFEEEDNAGLVIDGKPITTEEFTTILRSHEGWDFELRFVEPTD
jgi:hypothetical protein